MPSTPDVDPGEMVEEPEEITRESTEDQNSYTSDSQQRGRSNTLWDHELNSRVGTV